MKLMNKIVWLYLMTRRFIFIIAVSLTLLLVYFLWDGKNLVRQSKRVGTPRHRDQYNNTLVWVVNIDNASAQNYEVLVDDVAHVIGMENIGAVGNLDKSFIFALKVPSNKQINKLNSSLSSYLSQHALMYDLKDIQELIEEVEEKLEQNQYINWFSHEKVVSRAKRWFNRDAFMSFQDPMYKKQWHLTNTLERGMDINVTDVWRHNITGLGVTVAVVDDGLEWNNPDLMENYNKAGSWDFNDNDDDPMPDGSKESNHHGTRCAGEISALPNDICGVGVAYGAKVSGLRILDGPMTDSLEASAFTKYFQINDIYSCSWGPDDDGKTVDGPHVLAAAAIKHGIDFGRHGYGSIYVVASGNGGSAHDNCNFDGYANSIYTVTIGAVDETGHMPFYSEECASMLAVTFSSGNINTRDIVTTDWTSKFHQSRSGCTEHHTGTSAAAPLAAGMIALMLQVQPCLTWRDVQYLIILTAKKVDVDIAHWKRNGAGLWHSHKHGFGLLNAWRLTNAARVWNMVPWLTSYSYEAEHVNLRITKGKSSPLKVSYSVTKEETDRYALYILENVQVTVTIDHPCRGNLDIRLVSPSGTESLIGATRPHDNSSNGFDKWTFATVRCWGEKPYGTWTLTITDTDTSTSLPEGALKSWTLKMFGTPMKPSEFKERRRNIERAMHGEFLNKTSYCPPPPVTARPDVTLPVKTLKTIVLVGIFCIALAVYESMEYLFCYNDEKKEQAKKLKLLKRAHRLTRGAMQDRNNTDCDNEQTALLSEEIAMETFQTGSDLDCDLGSLDAEGNVTGEAQTVVNTLPDFIVKELYKGGSKRMENINLIESSNVNQNGNDHIDSRAHPIAIATEEHDRSNLRAAANVDRSHGQMRTKKGYMLLSNISEEEEDSV